MADETTLVTGSAGFIGFHLCARLLKEGKSVVGIDNFNSYYDPKLKKDRISNLFKAAKEHGSHFSFVEADISNSENVERAFKSSSPRRVVNLAAQAGVRYSTENPSAYISSNVVGFGNILEACRHYEVEHLVYASSSSVYGGNAKLPFAEVDSVDHPVSLYAATKRANELMAHCYSHLYGIPSTGLRFFTVYGPWGRPDMALFLFTSAIRNGEAIKVFNHGHMRRDFTYIGDAIEALFRILNKPAAADQTFCKEVPSPATSWAPHRILNIGNSQPESILTYISIIEECLGVKARIEFADMQPGDVQYTAADTTMLEEWINFKPSTSIRDGVSSFVEWYLDYYK